MRVVSTRRNGFWFCSVMRETMPSAPTEVRVAWKIALLLVALQSINSPDGVASVSAVTQDDMEP